MYEFSLWLDCAGLNTVCQQSPLPCSCTTTAELPDNNCVPLAGVENFGDVMILDPRQPVVLPAPLTHDAAADKAKPAGKAAVRRPQLRKD